MPLPTTLNFGSCSAMPPGSTGKYDESVDAYNHGLRIDPSSADGQSGLAQVYSQMGRTNDAEQILKKLVASNPGRRGDLMLLGDLSMRSKDYSGALGWLNKAEGIHPDARSEVLLAICYGQLNQKDLATHYLDLAERREPDNPDVLRTTAEYDRQTRKIRRCDQCPEIDSQPSAGRGGRARIHLSAGWKIRCVGAALFAGGERQAAGPYVAAFRGSGRDYHRQRLRGRAVSKSGPADQPK